MTTQEILSDAGDAFVSNLLSHQRTRRYYASGRSARSLEKVVGPNFVEVRGVRYWEQQQYGRRPGAPRDRKGTGPAGWFVRVIAEWAKVKGIRIRPYLIARKIVLRGTATFRGEREGVGIDEVTEATNADVGKMLVENYATETIARIDSILRQHPTF